MCADVLSCALFSVYSDVPYCFLVFTNVRVLFVHCRCVPGAVLQPRQVRRRAVPLRGRLEGRRVRGAGAGLPGGGLLGSGPLRRGPLRVPAGMEGRRL